MSILLGIELADRAARLVVIDRQAKVIARREEPLSVPVDEWWAVHPEERARATLGLLSGAVADGVFRPAQVAAIGITAEPALALLDADLAPIPPRDLPWEDLDPAAYRGRPWGAIHALFGASPRAMARIGLILDLVGFLRFRLTGAVGSQVDFAWRSGHVVGPRAAASWDAASLESAGILPSHVPPIFPAPQRVSVVGESTIEKTGLRRGTWVAAGGEPRNTRLLFAAEPAVGRSVILLGEETGEIYEGIETPDAWDAEIVPTALEGVFFRRVGEIPRAEVLAGGGPEDAVIDVVAGGDATFEGADDDLRIAADAGEASCGTAIAAGLGLGWWRDPRPIWRKRRPPERLGDRRARALETSAESLHPAADPTEEESEAPDV